MKKVITIIVAAVMVTVLALGIVACGPKARTDVEEKVMKASKMSLTELAAAAEEEFKAAGADATFVAMSPTSGVGKTYEKFQDAYKWVKIAPFQSNWKDAAMYNAIDSTIAKGNYWCDFALLQAGASYSAARAAGYIYNYAPAAADDLQLDSTDPYVALYTDKVFMYNKASMASVMGENWVLENVWQLTGADGANNKKGIPAGISFQDPTAELSNFSFMTMLTSDGAIAALTSAYKDYFGTDYEDNGDYVNIGYRFIHDFIYNVKNRHGSDTTILKETIVKDTTGIVYYVGTNKTKDYAKNVTGETHVWQDELWISGINGHLAGFDGFSYKFYTAIPSTAKLPYTACLYARFLASEEGFRSGWKDAGYYSANAKLPANTTKNVSYPINTKTLMEEEDFCAQAFFKVNIFVSSAWAQSAKK